MQRIFRLLVWMAVMPTNVCRAQELAPASPYGQNTELELHVVMMASEEREDLAALTFDSLQAYLDELPVRLRVQSIDSNPIERDSVDTDQTTIDSPDIPTATLICNFSHPKPTIALSSSNSFAGAPINRKIDATSAAGISDAISIIVWTWTKTALNALKAPTPAAPEQLPVTTRSYRNIIDPEKPWDKPAPKEPRLRFDFAPPANESLITLEAALLAAQSINHPYWAMGLAGLITIQIDPHLRVIAGYHATTPYTLKLSQDSEVRMTRHPTWIGLRGTRQLNQHKLALTVAAALDFVTYKYNDRNLSESIFDLQYCLRTAVTFLNNTASPWTPFIQVGLDVALGQKQTNWSEIGDTSSETGYWGIQTMLLVGVALGITDSPFE